MAVFTLTDEQVVVLSDVLFEACNSEQASSDEIETYVALRDALAAQASPQRPSARENEGGETVTDRDGAMFGTAGGDDLAEIVRRAMCENLPYRDRCRMAAQRVRDRTTRSSPPSPAPAAPGTERGLVDLARDLVACVDAYAETIVDGHKFSDGAIDDAFAMMTESRDRLADALAARPDGQGGTTGEGG